MRTVSARFTDHDRLARAVSTLNDAGLTETAVIPLADVDPPLAEPLLLAVRVDERHEEPIRDFLRGAGGALSDEVD